jgi:DNA-binding LacI/PurR family transcriptional regulator
MEEQPKYERLKQTIQHNIREGIWKPGDKLPAENVLCDHFGVSKITVKKAKDDLLAEGVLETRPGRKGVFIRKLHGISPSGIIGVVMDDIKNIPFLEMFKGIEDKLWEDKLHVILGNYYADPEKVEVYIQSLLQSNIAGVLFSPVQGTGYQEMNQRIIDRLTERHVPYVLIDRYLSNCLYNSVVSNNRQASKELIKGLIAKGHTRILGFAGRECSSMDERVQGYLDAFREAGIEPDPHLLIRLNEVLLSHDSGQQPVELERIKPLLEKAGDFTACYFMNMAPQTLLPTIFPDGKNADQEIEFATYDDVTEHLRGLTKRVTIVHQPGYKIGREAAKLLIEAIHDPDQRVVQITLKSEIVEEVIE